MKIYQASNRDQEKKLYKSSGMIPGDFVYFIPLFVIFSISVLLIIQKLTGNIFIKSIRTKWSGKKRKAGKTSS